MPQLGYTSHISRNRDLVEMRARPQQAQGRPVKIAAMSDTGSTSGRTATPTTSSRIQVAKGHTDKEACLVVIYGLELGKKFNLAHSQNIIGRSSKVDIQIDQEAVSRNHCEIINTGNEIMLRDMGSTNGTYINDEMIDEYALRDGGTCQRV